MAIQQGDKSQSLRDSIARSQTDQAKSDKPVEIAEFTPTVDDKSESLRIAIANNNAHTQINTEE